MITAASVALCVVITQSVVIDGVKVNYVTPGGIPIVTSMVVSQAFEYNGDIDDFSTPSIEYEYVWMKKYLFLAVLGLDGLALLFCICCSIAILYFRKHLTFVNTGFTLTSMFLIGYVMILMSVPLFGIDSNLTSKISVPKACMARIWLLSVGYSLTVGIMIVRIIFTAFMELIKEFKNYQIPSSVTSYFVIGLVIVDTLVVLAWLWFSPPQKDYVTKEIELIGLQDERRTLVETCTSNKESVLISFLCFYKGGLLLVALIICVVKREEEEPRTKDYSQCKMGLLSVLVAGAIALPVVLSLPYDPNKSFGVGGTIVILEAFFLMIWIQGSKIFNAYKCKRGEALEFGKYSVERSPRCVPCVRPVYGCIYNAKRKGLFNDGFVLDSALNMNASDPEGVKEVDEDDYLGDNGIGFDSKVSEDVLPSDLPSHDEYNLKPYDPDAEVDEEEEETDDESTDSKPEGESSDDDSSSSDDSDNEDSKENASSASAVARSAVSVHLNKSTVSQAFVDETQQGIQEEQQTKSDVKPHKDSESKSAESGRRRWWKPLFGGGMKPKTPIKEDKDMVASDDQSEESENKSQIMAPKRCVTPHGGSASGSEDDSSDDSDSD